MKTDKQTLLELQRSQPIEKVVRSTLSKYKGQRMLVVRAALDLGISVGTLYNWCSELEIDIDEYRRPVASAKGEEPGC